VKNLEANVLNPEFSVVKRTESPLSDVTVCFIAMCSLVSCNRWSSAFL